MPCHAMRPIIAAHAMRRRPMPCDSTGGGSTGICAGHVPGLVPRQLRERSSPWLLTAPTRRPRDPARGQPEVARKPALDLVAVRLHASVTIVVTIYML